MKIKEVCVRTELTDKAIRTYIRNGLVFPKYDEKYTGRKNFDFSEDDVKRLRQIAILRKYGFSLKEIKSLIDNEITAKDFLNHHIYDLKSDVNSNINVINSMLNVSNDSFENMEDMCAKLNNPQIAGRPVPMDDSKNPYKLLYYNNKKSVKIISIFCITTILALFILSVYVSVISDSHINKYYKLSEDYNTLTYNYYYDTRYFHKIDIKDFDLNIETDDNIYVGNPLHENISRFTEEIALDDKLYIIYSNDVVFLFKLENDFGADYYYTNYDA